MFYSVHMTHMTSWSWSCRVHCRFLYITASNGKYAKLVQFILNSSFCAVG